MTDFWWQAALFGLLCYFLANINFAVIISKRIKHRDIRKEGSGNPGTTNMLRTFGLKTGALTLCLDMLKGVVTTLVGLILFTSLYGEQIGRFAAYLGAACCVVGHIFPVLLKFKGGKGVACTLASFLILNPFYTLAVLGVGICLLLLTDKMSLLALFLFTSELLFYAVYCGITAKWGILICVSVICLLGIFAHRQNIRRLIQGKENATGIVKYFRKK